MIPIVIIPFGRYAGTPVHEASTYFLKWLLDPILSDGRRYHVTPILQDAARYWLKARRDGVALLAGVPQSRSNAAYLVERQGRSTDELGFATIEEAYACLALWPFDPEDDRFLLWDVLPSGHRKVIWHCSGWSWDQSAWNLPQGCLPGQTQSIYDQAMAALETEDTTPVPPTSTRA